MKPTSMLRSNCQTGDGVDQAEDEMSSRKVADVDHGLPQARFDNAIAHAYNEKKEK